jgi:CO/xanthine dehydrogenase Mo-binding subunit
LSSIKGRVTNNNLGDYKLPSIADLFELKTVLVPSAGGVGPHNAKPIGEFANNAPPAAIANAIADAVGVRLFRSAGEARADLSGVEEKASVVKN